MTTAFDPKTHSYLIDGKPATGVTTIISVLAKPALIGWAAKMVTEWIRENCEWTQDEPDNRTYKVTEQDLNEAKSAHTKKKEAAGTHGTDAHAWIEAFVKDCLERGVIASIEGKWPKGIQPFVDWAIENVDHFLFSERQMFNKELFIAGTADFAYIGKDGKRYIADFKTSSGIYGIDYWLQVAAYRFLAESEGDPPYDGATVVRMGKDGSFEVQQRFDYTTDKEAFLACLTLYRAQATYTKHK